MVAGGYVVLEKPNAALVAAVSARIYAAVRSNMPTNRSALPSSGIQIIVRSEQMGELREYFLRIDKQWHLESACSLPPNPYVEAAISKTLMVINQLGGRLDESLEISIYGDNAFYSIGSAPKDGSPNPRFAKIARKADPPVSNASGVEQQQQQHAAEVQKTGLGSSAALVTAVVGALLSHSGAVSLPRASEDGGAETTPPGRFSGESALCLVHNLAQLCHCAAQVDCLFSAVTCGFSALSARTRASCIEHALD